MRKIKTYDLDRWLIFNPIFWMILTVIGLMAIIIYIYQNQ